MYSIIRFIIATALRQFFSRIEVRGASLVNEGPLLVVSNHPNLALDPLVIGLLFNRPLWFLAKSTLFTGILGPLLRAVHVIPVYRKQDDPSQMGNNKKTFSVAARVLAKGGGVAIFPEGISMGERRISQVKTGAARIIVQALQDYDGAPISVQAVGITYGDLQRFRARLTMVVHEARVLSRESILSSEDPIKELTSVIEGSLRSVTVNIPTAEQQDIAEHIARVYGSTARETDEYDRFRLIAAHLAVLTESDREGFRDLEDRIRSYVRRLDSFGLLDGSPIDLPVSWLKRGAGIILGALGGLLFYFPYQCIGKFAARAEHPVEVASRKFFGGLIIFPTWIVAVSLCALLVWGIPGAVVCAVILILVGLVANRTMSLVRRAVFSVLGVGLSSILETLIRERDGIIAELEAIRASLVGAIPPEHREKESIP